jgi:hypothetical protein
MANILKLQDDLKGLPDNALIQYAQSPNGQVPQYLVLGELQRRKTMREEYQQSQTQAPQSTVAEDLEQGLGSVAPQGQPQEAPQQPQEAPQEQPVMQAAAGGLADLDVPDHMFQEHNMAGGGIVAFDEGGHVPRYAGNTDGSLVGGTSLNSALSQYQKRRNEIYKLLNEGAPGPHGSRIPLQGWRERTALQNELDNLDKGIAQINTQSALPVAQNPVAQNPATPAAGNNPQTPPGTTPQTSPAAPGLPNMSFGFKPLTSVYDTPEAAARSAELKTPVPLGQTREEFAGEKPTVESSVGNVKDFQKAFGVNEDVYKNQEERLKSQEGKLSEQKQTAGWMALAQAGLSAAAGSSPYALKNIAEGGVRGLSEYNNAMDKLQDREDKLNTARFNLEDAQNKFRQTGSATALQQYNSALNDYKSANRSYTQMEHNAATTAKSLDASMFSAEQSERGATNRGNLQATQHAQGLGLQYAQLRQTAAHQKAMMDMYDKKIEASDKATAARLFQVRANYLAKIKTSAEYADKIAELNKKYAKSTIKGASNPDYQRELQMYVTGELAPLLENKLNELGLAQPAESLLQG